MEIQRFTSKSFIVYSLKCIHSATIIKQNLTCSKIQMIRRLVKQKQCRLDVQGTGQGDAHPPASAVVADDGD